MDNNSNENEQERLIRRHQQEQQRYRLLQQQQQLSHDPRLGTHQGHDYLLSSTFSPAVPPHHPQLHQGDNDIPPPLRQQHIYPYGPSPMSSWSCSSSSDPRSEQVMSSSSSGDTLHEPQHHQQHPIGLSGSRHVSQDSAGEMCVHGSMPTTAQAQEDEGLTLHRQQFQRLQQEQLLQQQQRQQQQHRASISTSATPRLPFARPLHHGQAHGLPLWHQPQQQHHTSHPNTPFLAPAQPTSPGRQRSSPRMSSPTSGQLPGPVSSSSSSYPRSGPLGFGRVNPYPPPMLTTRIQENQRFRRARGAIDVEALPNYITDTALRQQDHHQQQQSQSQRDLPPHSSMRTTQPFSGGAGRGTFTAASSRQTHPPPSTYDFGGGGSGVGYDFDSACPYEPRPVETVLPVQAPISIYGPRNNGSDIGDDAGAGGELEMDYILEEEERGPPPIEVTLNVDIPKSSRPPTVGVPSTTVLNVNPSWHVVFVETIQQQRIRTSIRIQFCPSSSTARLIEHRAKVRRLQTVQVIGYASRRVELSRRIQGQTLLNRGGLTIHLDPASITFNEASYGFTLSLSSFEIEQLSRTHNSRPDNPLPLARQQNSAYCRRNLKEMYYDTVSKDVAITLRPSGEVFYAHSVVLESHSYFRALIEQQHLSRLATDGQDAEEEEAARGMVVETEAVVDEEGYAQPLRPQPQQRSFRYPYGSSGGIYCAGGGGGSGSVHMNQDRFRAKIMIEVNDTSPTVFRAVLHYMYMGHVPVTGVFQQQQQQQQPSGPSTAAGQTNMSGATQDAGGPSISTSTHTNSAGGTGAESGSSSLGMTGMEALTEAVSIAATESTAGASSSSAGGLSMAPPSSSLTTATTATPATATSVLGAATDDTSTGAAGAIDPTPPVVAAAAAPVTETMQMGEFPWRELYEIATRYQLSGLMHLSKVSLLSRLDVEQAIRELFEWSYHYKSLIPAYVSFLIERVDAMVLSSGGIGGAGGASDDGGGNAGASILWPYHDLCPAFDEIMMEFMRLLSERRDCGTLI